MTPRLIFYPAIIIWIALILFLDNTSTSEAQESPLDLGEQSSLIVGCDYIRDLIMSANYTMKYCRVREPEEVSANKVKLKLLVRDNYYPVPLEVEVRLRKSLWHIENVKITGAR